MTNWKEVQLADVCNKIGSGATPRGGNSVYLDSGEISLIRSQNVYNGRFTVDGLAFISPEHADQLSNVEVEADDVLLNITGDSVARCCQVPNGILPARVNQHVSIIRPDRSKLWPRYLAYYLLSPQMQDYMLGLAHAGATRKALTKGMIESFPIPCPELNTQKRIAGILGALDDKIELNRRMNETLEGMARAIFQSWFVDFDPVIDNALAAGHAIPAELEEKAARRKQQKNKHPLPKEIRKLFPDSFTDSPLGPIPTGWITCKIEDIANINAWTLRRGELLDTIDYIEISEVLRGELGKVSHFVRGSEPSRARRRLQHGDTILSTVRPDRGAYFLVLNPSESLIASTGFCVLSSNSGNWALLHAATTRPEFGEELGLLADGGAYPAVRPETVGDRQLTMPRTSQLTSLFEQTARPLFERANSNRNQSQTLVKLRDTLLPKLLSGEIEV